MEESKSNQEELETARDIQNLKISKNSKLMSGLAIFLATTSIITSAVAIKNGRKDKDLPVKDTPSISEENDAASLTLTDKEIKDLGKVAFTNNEVIIKNAGYNQSDIEDVVSIMNNNVAFENESDRISEPADAEVFFNDLATDTINSRLEEMGVYEKTGESGIRLFQYQDIMHKEVNSFFTDLDQDYRKVLDGKMSRDEFIAKYYKVAINEDKEQFLASQDGTAGVELAYFYAVSQAFTDILMQDPNASIPANLIYKDAADGTVVRVDTMFGYVTKNAAGETSPYVSKNGDYPMEYATVLEKVRRTAIREMIAENKQYQNCK